MSEESGAEFRNAFLPGGRGGSHVIMGSWVQTSGLSLLYSDQLLPHVVDEVVGSHIPHVPLL